MDGETIDRHPGEHAGPGSPPGWYADPVRKSSLRRWDGAHWTADVEPWPTPPGAGSNMSESGHGTFDKDDVKGCFLVTGLAAGMIVLLAAMFLAMFAALLFWAFSQAD